MEMKQKNWKVAVFAALLLGVVATAGSAIFGWAVIDPNSYNVAIVLPMLGIFGLIALICAVSVLVVVIGALGLTNPNYALGLPQGTVRAVIALSLIVIFLITAIFLYSDVAKPEYRTSKGISAEDIKKLPQTKIVGVRATEDGKFDVDVVVGNKTEASVDLAKQLLTTVGTLLVAMIGFYFGSRTVAAGRGVGEVASLRILSPESPYKMGKDDRTPLPLKIEVKPNGEAVAWDPPAGDAKGRLTQLEPGSFEYTRGADPNQIAEEVVLKFRLVRHPEATAEMKITSS